MTNHDKLSLEELLYEQEQLSAELRRRGVSGPQPGGVLDTQTHPTLGSAEEAALAYGQRSAREEFETWLRAQEQSEDTRAKPCPKCGRKVVVNAKKRARTVATLHGEFSYRRHHHYCRHCQHGFHPLDEHVDAPEQGQASEGLTKRALDFAINAPYEEASERFEMHYGMTLSTHALRCMVERLALPSFDAHVPIEEPARITAQVDGSMVPMTAGWKEAKLGTVVCQEHHKRGSKQGKRGEITRANYIATLGGVDTFAGVLQRALPGRLGPKERYQGVTGPEVVWVADGAPWVWKLQQKLCPQAIAILDWYHAVSNGAQCGKELLGEDSAGLCALWDARIKQLLGAGDVPALLEELRACREGLRAGERKAVDRLLGYYRRHRRRMNYPEHRAAGRVIGSGLVESGHRHVLQTRMKRAGQHWSLKGAEKMARLRCLYKTHGPQNFYDSATKMAA